MKVVELILSLKKSGVVLRFTNNTLALAGNTHQLGEAMLQQVRLAKPHLEALLQRSAGNIPANSEKASCQNVWPLSPAQQRLWLLSSFNDAAPAYTIIKGIIFKGVLDAGLFNTAITDCIERHNIFRTVFEEQNGVLQQRLLNSHACNIHFTDASNDADAGIKLAAMTESAKRWCFNPVNGPLFNIQTMLLPDNRMAMIFGIHHIITDGWSLRLLVHEIMQRYDNLLRARPLPPAPAFQYGDYVLWQQKDLEADRMGTARRFWIEAFATPPEPLNLPADFQRPEENSTEGAVYRYYFDSDFYQSLRQFCSGNNITLFHLLRTALTILLCRLCRQQDIVVGVPASGRTQQWLENIQGLFVNTLPLRWQVNPEITIAEMLRQIALHSQQALLHQQYPFDYIVKDAGVKPAPGRNPLFDVMLSVQDVAWGNGLQLAAEEYGLQPEFIDTEANQASDRPFAVKFDLNFNFDTDPQRGFYAELEYSTRLFLPQTIRRFAGGLLQLLQQIMHNPAATVGNLSIIAPGEKQQILEQFNKPVLPVEEQHLLQLLEQPFAQNAGAVAVINGNDTFTYEKIWRLSGNLAAALRQNGLTTAQPFVGLLLDRTEWMIISILGILKAGGAYVPADASYPQNRINYIFADALPSIIITDAVNRSKVPQSFNGQVILAQDIAAMNMPEPVMPEEDFREAPAYLIYTSGSTGTPKGVEICHRNAISFLKWANAEFAATPYQTLYAVTSYCFDLSVFEFFLPLLQGKTIRLLQSALDIPVYAGNETGIFINTVPSVVRHLLDAGMNWNGVVAVNMAGEPVPKIIKQELDWRRMEVRNLYGPSEDTTYSTVYRFDDTEAATIPIGVPVDATQVYIMDAQRNLLPIGVEGEIYISGQCVAKGYFNKPQLTAAVFLDNPFQPGMPMYKTGDVGKWMPCGNILFTGRVDDQVKIRGYRIEPGEIQYVLEQHEAVERGVVMVKTIQGQQHLVAYFTGNAAAADDIRQWMAAKLPGYMQPDYLLHLDAVPLNSNGKVDNQRLPLPVLNAAVTTPPQTPLEARLLSIWNGVLKQEVPGTTNNFFDAGGHSLLALQLRWAILKHLNREISIPEIFTHNTIQKQAALLENRFALVQEPVLPAPPQPWYPVSVAQERLWVLTRFEEASKAYHMPAVFAVSGRLDSEVLTAAIQQVVQRYEILRTVFRTEVEQPVQVILPQMPVIVQRLQLEADNEYDAVIEKLRQLWQQPFNLEAGPLLRCWLTEGGQRQYLSFCIHHIISDGWSVPLLLNAIAGAYKNIITGQETADQASIVQYKDFAVWQHQRLQGPWLQTLRDFWTKQFTGELPVLEMPCDFRRPAVKTYRGQTIRLKAGATLLQQLNDYCRQNSVTLFTMLTGSVAILLNKYSGQSDIIICTPVAGREHPDTQHQPGFFVNTLPLRFVMDEGQPFTNWITLQQQHIVQAFEHQAYPFEMLVNDVQPVRNLSRSPLSDVMVMLQNPDGLRQTGRTVLTELVELERLNADNGTAKYDLTFLFEAGENGLLIELEYNTSLYRRQTAERLLHHLVNILQHLPAGHAAVPGAVNMLSPAEEKQVLEQFNKPVSAIHEYNIWQLLQPAFSINAGNTAIICGNTVLTYEQLEQKARAVAAQLLTVQPQIKGRYVGMLMGRTENSPAAMLGIILAGAAYVPVDLQYPAGRIGYIINDAAPVAIITDNEGYSLVPENYTGMVLRFDDIDGGSMTPVYLSHDLRESPAYLIYTSGSTGQPKGVEICHRNTIAFLKWAAAEFARTPFSILYATTSWCFDLSVFEIFFPLMQGKTIRILPSALKIQDYVTADREILINTVPSAVRSLLDAGMNWSNVTALNMAGEPIPLRIRDEIDYNAIEVRNLYGPSEDTTYSTCYLFKADGYDFIPIGRPVADTHLYIMDKSGCLLPPGITGQIYLSGQSVAKGYSGKPELTKEHFLSNPFVPGLTMYKTGDMGYWLHDGQVVYQGRADGQVKIRGYRIEPGEIQYLLERHPQVREAVVTVYAQHGDACLAAYYTSDNKELQAAALKTYLAQNLPIYMVPDFWIHLDQIPLNSNGKVDKKALPQPVKQAPAETYRPPRNETDKQIIAVWEAILQTKGIGINDNFFNLGGHSLNAVRAVAKIHEIFGVRIDLEQLFIEPTVAHLSDYVDILRWAASPQPQMAGNAGEEIII